MILSSRRAAPLRALAVAVAAALAPAIAGCAAGEDSPTQRWHQPTAGASAVHDDIRINNVFVLGMPPAFSLVRGGSASMFLALANSGPPDRLIAITAPGTAAAVQLPSGGVGLVTGQPVLLTGPAPQVILRGLTRSVNGGQTILVVLQFLRAGRVPMRVPVMPRAQWFSTFSPPPPLVSPSPTSTSTPGPPGQASPSPAATSPAASPAPTG